MGSSQSSRKLTINNEDGVIQISTDLVQRLAVNSKKSIEDSSGEKSVTLEPAVTPPSSSPPPTPSASLQPTPAPIHSTPVQKALPTQNQPIQSYPEYTITAYKMQQQKELELQAQDQYWQKRLQNLKLTQEKINRVFQDEYKRAVDEVTNAKGNKNIDLNTTTPACGADKEKVLRCYQENPREILKCSSLVEEFNNCVDQRRSGLISARC